MHYGIVITTGDPHVQAELAVEAERAGWDGAFTWDAIDILGMDGYDPWVLLTAMAMRTERIRLGAMVFAPTRRRPWKLAREATTLDIVSGGRLILPVGLGAIDDQGFGNVGEPVEARVRAAILDETLAILAGLWTGEPFGFEGAQYRFGPMHFQPTPVQRPRVPVWVVGAWPHVKSMRRAAAWDGIVVQANGPDGSPATGPELLPDIVSWLSAERARAGLDGPFEIVVDRSTPADDPATAIATAEAHAAAGATWWIESEWVTMDPDALRRRIVSGPPRAA